MKKNMTAAEIRILVGSRIRRRRRLLEFTQERLGKKIGVRFQQIHKYECGTNAVSAERLYQLAIALDVPVSFFFEDTTVS